MGGHISENTGKILKVAFRTAQRLLLNKIIMVVIIDERASRWNVWI